MQCKYYTRKTQLTVSKSVIQQLCLVWIRKEVEQSVTCKLNKSFFVKLLLVRVLLQQQKMKLDMRLKQKIE